MPTSPPYADLVLRNGKILTLAQGLHVTEALAVKDGLVMASGLISEVGRLVGPTTEVVDLDGRTVIPGINDGHMHPIGMGTFSPPFTLSVRKQDVSSIADIRRVVAEAVRTKKPGEWIRGFGWDVGALAEDRMPTRWDLDDLTPDNPVVLVQWSGHASWVNSRALEIAGITGATEPPPGGEIVKDEAGEPTGVLTEGAAWAMNAVIPPYSREERLSALITATRTMGAYGITSFTDAGLDLEALQIYREAIESGDLPQRVTLMIMASKVGDLRSALAAAVQIETDPRRLQISQVKIAADGVPTQAKTAWVSEPYRGGGTGGLTLPGDSHEAQLAQFQEWVDTAHSMGFQVGTHATGDRAIIAAIDAYERATATYGTAVRHYVIHSDFPYADVLRRMALGGFAATFNPNIKQTTADQLVEVMGRERIDYEWPYRTALAAGVRVSSSSDAPVVAPSFQEGLYTMLTRRSRASGIVYGPGETIALEEALRTYTVAPAWQDCAEGWKGTLAPGMVADLVVLDGDLLTSRPEDILDLGVALTMVGGRTIYEAC